MSTSLSDIIKIPAALLIGAAISALIVITSYEGLRLPLIGQVIDGRVAEAVNAAKEDLVAVADLAAARAEAEKLAEDLARAETLRQMAERNVAALMQQDEDDAKTIAAAQSADDGADGARYTARDIEWMRHRQRRAR
ncbi:hypothetical protein [Allorhizobium undicola]|uniref:hypothetical protein n=1 Tax=Allorhizobium undicola TaxID=78527 RepID=UPI000483DE47|nr:hypothetical protein [Allorhizobium undicola]